MRHAVFTALFVIAATVTAHSQPECAVAGPDSVFFDKAQYNRYLPSDFEIVVRLRNSGISRIDSVVVFPRSNPRFTVIPPAVRFVADSLALGDSLETRFRLIVHPRETSGIDTVVVSVSGKAGNRCDCALPVWVEKEYRPLNMIDCPPDSAMLVAFVDTLNLYQPSPLAARLRIENRGDSPSKNTRLLYVATPGLAPADGQDAILDLGTLNAGASTERIFLLRVVPRADDTTVALRFKVQGQGGLGDRIIDTVCETPVRIPPAHDAVLEVLCENSIPIVFDNGQYTPNPFLWTAEVRNTGDGFAKDVRAAITLPPHFVLDTLEQAEQTLGDLRPGGTRTVSWRVRALPVTRADTGIACIRVFDSFGHLASCCDTLLLPPVRAAELRAGCLVVPDSIGIDIATGAYQPAEALARVTVINAGTESADSVWAEIVIDDADTDIAGGVPARRLAAARLAPQGLVELEWRLVPRPSPQARVVSVLFRVVGIGIRETVSSCRLHVAASLTPVLACSMETTPADTLHYNLTTLIYDSLTATATVRNLGSIAATDVRASLLLPPGMSIAAGDSAVRLLETPLGPGAERTLRWRLMAQPRREGTLDTVRIEFRSGAVTTACGDWIFIVGIPPVTVLSIPVNNLAQYNHELSIPVEIDNTDGKRISRLELAIAYDAQRMKFLGYDRANDMLERWTLRDAMLPGLIAFTADADTTVLHGEGKLLHLRFRVTFGSGDDALRATVTPLRFDTLASAVNRGTILARYFDGAAVLSGDCLPPLDASERFVLLQTSPNPSDGAVHVHAALRDGARLRVSVHDLLGRELLLLGDAVYTRGTHTFSIPARALAPGRYFCRAFTVAGSAVTGIRIVR